MSAVAKVLLTVRRQKKNTNKLTRTHYHVHIHTNTRSVASSTSTASTADNENAAWHGKRPNDRRAPSNKSPPAPSQSVLTSIYNYSRGGAGRLNRFVYAEASRRRHRSIVRFCNTPDHSFRAAYLERRTSNVERRRRRAYNANVDVYYRSATSDTND